MEVVDDLKPKYFGGVLKKTYYTPDGREIKTSPAMRTFANPATGEGGIRDANYDKGWLDQPPVNPLPYCTACDKWHNTQEEVDKCIAARKKAAKIWERKANKENGESMEKRVTGLEDSLKRIENLLVKALGDEGG